MNRLPLAKIFIFLFLMLGNALSGQGTFSLVPQSPTSNGLHQVDVVWSGYGTSEKVIKMFVQVIITSPGLVFLDRNAMASPLGFPSQSPTLSITPSGYSSNSFTLQYGASGSSPGFDPSASGTVSSQTLFSIFYTSTPNCNSTVDTSLSIYFDASLCSYYRSMPTSGFAYPTLSHISTSPLTETFGCNYVSGSIDTPPDRNTCDDAVGSGIPRVFVDAFFRLPTTPTVTNVIVGFYDNDHNGVPNSTGYNGDYLIESLPSGMNLRVQPTKSDPANMNNEGENCVTTTDTRLLNYYITGASIAGFPHPWNLIAGDVDRNGTMTSADGYLINSIIAGFIPGPWTFITQGDYSILANPDGTFYGYPFNDYVDYNPLSTNKSSQDYYGIKLGDINGSCTDCVPIVTGHNATEDREKSGIITIPLVDRVVKPGEEFEIPISLEIQESMNILAWELQFDPEKFDFMGVRGGSLPNLNDAIFTAPEDRPGIIRFVWSTVGSQEITADRRKNLFSFSLRAKTSVSNLHDYISIASFGKNPCYGKSDIAYHPMIRWSNMLESAPVCKVSPVPFKQSFKLSFRVDQEGPATLRVLSAAGRTVYEQSLDLTIGEQELQVNNTTDWPAGLYMYELQQTNTHYRGLIMKN